MRFYRSRLTLCPNRGSSRAGRSFGLGGLLLALLLAQLSLPVRAVAAEPGPDLSGIAWSRLLFVATEAAAEVSAEVSLAPVPPAELGALFPADAGAQAGPAPGAEAMLMTGLVTIQRYNKAFKTEVWFLPRDGRALKRRRLKSGKAPSLQTFWYLPDGVRRERADPAGRGEAKRPPEKWSRVREHLYPYGPPRNGCTTLTDPLILVLVAQVSAGSAENPKDGLCAFNKKTLHHAAWRPGGADKLKVDYNVTGGGSPTRVNGRVAARKVVLKTKAAYGAGRKPDPFEVFEMTGEIAIWLEESSGLPLQISGQVSGIGTVTFMLTEATLRP